MPQHITDTYAVSMHVNDFDDVCEFYGKGLGLKELSADAETGLAEYQIPGGTSLVVHSWDSPCQKNGGREPGTVTGLIVTVDDAQAFAETVEKAGGEITDPVEEMASGSTGGTAADPDGNEFVFAEPRT